MTFCFNFWSYVVVCVMFGLFLSAWPAVTSSLLVDILGLEHLTSAFGVLTCIRGLSAFLGPPLGGFVIDATSPEKIVNVTESVIANMTTVATTESETETEVDNSNYEVAFWISAVLLLSSSVGHLLAFFVKKVSQKRAASMEKNDETA